MMVTSKLHVCAHEEHAHWQVVFFESYIPKSCIYTCSYSLVFNHLSCFYYVVWIPWQLNDLSSNPGKSLKSLTYDLIFLLLYLKTAAPLGKTN